MKERPILFSGEMVDAIRRGDKSQTRRLVKPQPIDEFVSPITCEWYHQTKIDRYGEEYPGERVFGFANDVDGRVCPHGAPGDRLWIKETFQLHTTGAGIRITYKAGGEDIFVDPPEYGDIPDDNNWRPSIFMFRWASRITLEITGVRVERLQDITEADAIAEGIRKRTCGRDLFCYEYDPNEDAYDTAVEAYKHLWESINGPGSWARNDWVWRIEFRKII